MVLPIHSASGEGTGSCLTLHFCVLLLLISWILKDWSCLRPSHKLEQKQSALNAFLPYRSLAVTCFQIGTPDTVCLISVNSSFAGSTALTEAYRIFSPKCYIHVHQLSRKTWCKGVPQGASCVFFPAEVINIIELPGLPIMMPCVSMWQHVMAKEDLCG